MGFIRFSMSLNAGLSMGKEDYPLFLSVSFMGQARCSLHASGTSRNL